MIFSSLDFVLFMIVLVITLRLAQQRPEHTKKIILLVASYYFYGYWDWRFLSLLVYTTAIDHLCATRIHASSDDVVRKRWLVISIVSNLGVLAAFKYFNFFIDALNDVITLEGEPLRHLNIILPLGISFFTFQTMSYTIDIYRRKLAPSSLMDFSIFVVFFPQMVAGPIVRAASFLPQLVRPIEIRFERIVDGSRQFLVGFVKKAVIADSLSIFVDEVFRQPSAYDGATLAAAVIAYAIQIYCDFSGYSDMAIGVGRMLGFELPVNFRHPYKARNITEFWRRWHISLSSWLRDYLYISLGGNRKGRVRTYINLMATMTLGGLWHGASYNFIIWGIMHGTALAVHKFVMEVTGSEKVDIESEAFQQKSPGAILRDALSVVLTFMLVCVAWIFFRAPTLQSAMDFLIRIATWQDGIHWLHISFLLVAPVFFLWHWLPGNEAAKYRVVNYNTAWGVSACFTLLMIILLFSPLGLSPFIYFQF